MRADLIERLRHLVSLNEQKNDGPYAGYAATKCIEAMHEAADALAALSSPVAAAQADVARLTAELERCREAFRAITKIEFAGSCCGCSSDDSFDEVQAIARAALGGSND